MKPNRLRAEIGTSPKAQFLCRTRDEGASKISLAGTKHLEKLHHWKHFFVFEGQTLDVEICTCLLVNAPM